MPEAVSTVPPLALITPTTVLVPENTSITPPILPATSSKSEPFMTISTTEFCAMHLVILPPPQADIPCPSEPVAPTEDATTAKALIQTTQEATRDPSVPLPPSIFNHSCHIEGNVDLGWGES
ncbi:hypothetical protein AAG906_010342 [Vitis piasezkii]